MFQGNHEKKIHINNNVKVVVASLQRSLLVSLWMKNVSIMTT
jgi:hypothetical protein